MQKKRCLRLIIISFCVVILLLINTYDFIRGKTYSFGPLQVIANTICLVFILLGIFINHPFVEPIVHRCIRYFRSQFDYFKRTLNKYNAIIFIFLFLLCLLTIIYFYTTGLDYIESFPDYIGAGTPGTVFQVVLSVILGFLCIVPNLFTRTKRNIIVDLFFSLCLLILSIRLWSSLPIEYNFFSRLINKSSAIIYPFSDSRVFDINALAFLHGQGMAYGEPSAHTLYSFFLAFLHLLFKNDYGLIMQVQVQIFSIIPILIYFTGKKFGSRAIGMIASLLLIFHEYNQILLSSLTTLVNVQMIMTEIFTELIIIALSLITFSWFKNPAALSKAILSGLCLGLAVLTRTQTIIFLAIYIFYFIYNIVNHRGRLIKSFLIFSLAFLAIIIPWMSRNFVRNGNFSLDDPAYISIIVTKNGNNEIGGVDSGKESNLADEIYNRILTNGRFYANRTLSFATNSILNSFYQFPLTFQNYDVAEYVTNVLSGYPFPYIDLTKSQFIILFLNVLVVTWGITFASSRYGFSGFFPLLAYVLYIISSALLGYTGFRFNQPVDWVFLLYWAVGAVSLLSFIISHSAVFPVTSIPEKRGNSKELNPWLIIFTIFLGLSFPISEALISKQVINLPNSSKFEHAITNNYNHDYSTNEYGEITFDNGYVAETGYALYPLLFSEESQWKNLRNNGFIYSYSQYQITWSNAFISREMESGKDVLFFTLSTDNIKDVTMDDPIIISSDGINNYAFHNSQIFVYGCLYSDHFEAYYLQILKDSKIFEIVSGNTLPESCK